MTVFFPLLTRRQKAIDVFLRGVNWRGDIKPVNASIQAAPEPSQVVFWASI